MDSRRGASRALRIVILGMLALTSVAFLGLGPLAERDEAIHAEVAREILITGDWVTLHFGGEPWFDKPPLVFWASAASMRLFGVSEGTARLPVALCGALLMLTAWSLARRMHGESTGLLAAAITASSPMIAGAAGIVLMDVPLTLFLTIALALFHLSTSLTSPRMSAIASAGAGVAMGLGVLTKGPVALALPGFVVILAMIASRNLRPRWAGALPTAIGVCILISLPWYLMAYQRNGAAFVDSFIGFHNVGRFMQSEHKKGASALLYAGVLVAGFLPWTAEMVSGVVRGSRERRSDDLLLLIWTFVILAFFGLARTKLAAYILPAFPPIAILAARNLSESRCKDRLGGYLWWGTGSVLVALMAAILATQRGNPALPAAVVWLAVSMGVLFLSRGETGRVRLHVVAFGGCVLALALQGLVLPAVREQAGLRDAVRLADSLGGPLKVRDASMPGSVLFYARKGAETVRSGAEARPGDVLLLRKVDLPEVAGASVRWQGNRWCVVQMPFKR